MLLILSALLVAFCVSISTIKVLLPLAPHIGLVDLPNDRKKHDGAIPLIGGISIYTGVLIASTFFVEQNQIINLYFISSALLVFIGTMDDIYDLSVAPRMIFQGIVASLMVFGAGIYIYDFGNLFSFGNVNVGSYGMIFTMLACVAAINAFNMIDGIDGLAGSMSIISILSITLLTMLNDNSADVLLPLILVVAIIPYLFYNVSTRNPRGKKIFMGDAGSMFMGLTVIWLLTLKTQDTVYGEASFRAVTALWVIAVPLMDMFAIMIRRMRKGVSPFRADNGHLHHICMRLGLSSRQALWAISALAVIFSSIGIMGEIFNVSEPIMLSTFLLIFCIYSYSMQHAWRLIKHINKNI
ncbi:UDP-N-acetylglucosamine--undecaprenyl-phosphate N-acetylglucosaminephosphotransferase [Thalassotalea sp. 1_MG-2023]|uniref:UDP-N-acetylglucosamine--undecaprenyl-phosphate N-acetylglucosaminephosphotransferase n=1 Tax=Thalassotalea sp. 1_MG-2023 TaxID=3062680 RepID=UPI0026E1E51C|nr:UDP-N-acetylglucosamine--undecaprenyl-phosphate N-acetylglucosaminephosphotransferase [Thalassotalea sp. 1_MG-2023]MDO6426492.1 UDP-N-acetylglucosamine--undecaprenyl-phosphate N-acetylglucosaminephosphotransferase [Thalassotalea sp. 1_MG-2023]